METGRDGDLYKRCSGNSEESCDPLATYYLKVINSIVMVSHDVIIKYSTCKNLLYV